MSRAQPASLDVIGHILNGDLPDREVVDQILVVINNLLALPEQAIKVATDAELEAILSDAPVVPATTGAYRHGLARINLLQTVMQARIYRCNHLQVVVREFAPTWNLSLTI